MRIRTFVAAAAVLMGVGSAVPAHAQVGYGSNVKGELTIIDCAGGPAIRIEDANAQSLSGIVLGNPYTVIADCFQGTSKVTVSLGPFHGVDHPRLNRELAERTSEHGGNERQDLSRPDGDGRQDGGAALRPRTRRLLRRRTRHRAGPCPAIVDRVDRARCGWSDGARRVRGGDTPLGTITTDGSGHAKLPITLGCDIAPGTYSLRADGTSSAGAVASTAFELTVAKCGTAKEVGEKKREAAKPGTSGPPAFTGSNVGTQVGAGAGLLAAGAALVVAFRRRRANNIA